MADSAGFYLDDNDNVVYVDALGVQYYPNPQMDPADADAYGIKYVRCDEGKYYYQAASGNPADDYGISTQRDSNLMKESYGYQQEDSTARMSSSDEEELSPPTQRDSEFSNDCHKEEPPKERVSDSILPRPRDSKSCKKPKPHKQGARRTKSSSSARSTSSTGLLSHPPCRSKSGDLLARVEAAMNAGAPQELDEKEFEKALKRESNRRKKEAKKGRSQSPKRGESSHGKKMGRKPSGGDLASGDKSKHNIPKPATLSRSRSTGEEAKSRKEKHRRSPGRALSASPPRARSESRQPAVHSNDGQSLDRPSLHARPTLSRQHSMRSPSRRNLMVEPREEEGNVMPTHNVTISRAHSMDNPLRRNLMIEPREEQDDTDLHTQQVLARAHSPRRSPSRDETSPAASPCRRGGRPALSRENSTKNCRRAGMGRSRADRVSQRNLMRQHYTAAIDHYDTDRKEMEEQAKEQAAMERIKELEAQLAQVQQQHHIIPKASLSGDESPSRQVSPSNSAKEGLMGLANAAMLVGKTAVNTTVGAGKLAANVGLATTHLAADTTMLLGKTAVNTTVGAAKLTADAALATTHMATDATILVGKTAVNTTVGAAKLTADAALATTHLATDVGKTAMNTTVGAVQGATAAIASGPLRSSSFNNSQRNSSKKVPMSEQLGLSHATLGLEANGI